MKDTTLQEKLKKLDLQELIDFLEEIENYKNDILEKADESEIPNVTEIENEIEDMKDDIQSLKKDMEKLETHTHTLSEPMEEE